MSYSVRDSVNHLVAYHQVLPNSIFSQKETPTFPLFGFAVPNVCYGHGWHTDRQVSILSGDLSQIRQFTQAEREDQRQSNAAVIGGMATVLFAGLMACAIKQVRGDTKELAHAKIALKNLALDVGNPQVLTLQPILCKHIEILEAKCAKARHIAALAVAIFATAAAAFAGGMFAISWLITTATVATVAIAAIGAFALVWHSDDEQSLPPAMQQELRALANGLLT
ncbi:MAG TPA: hypothetical protein VGO47_14925 [Chlamydiales bacterium]|jgi:hypothetical protein|nr:hypothetical protein [Chlamydiales bacterium]